MQTMPPIDNAVTKYGGAVHPIIKKTKHVNSNVATVMPEIGFDDEPTSPVSREDTVTNRKPNATINNAPMMFHCKLSCGATMIAMIRMMMPPSTNFMDRS